MDLLLSGVSRPLARTGIRYMAVWVIKLPFFVCHLLEEAELQLSVTTINGYLTTNHVG